MWKFAEADLADARRLIEKVVALGGEPVDEIRGFGLPKTGDSEALERRLEHIIMRKQEQVDTLLRAQRS